jgi:hypothetical protein
VNAPSFPRILRHSSCSPLRGKKVRQSAGARHLVYTYKLAPMTFPFAPDLPAQSILGRSVKPNLSETSLALIVSGTQ